MAAPYVGTRRIVVKGRIYDVELTVDIAGLMDQVGYQAAHNKTGRAGIGGGLVKAKAKFVAIQATPKNPEAYDANA